MLASSMSCWCLQEARHQQDMLDASIGNLSDVWWQWIVPAQPLWQSDWGGTIHCHHTFPPASARDPKQSATEEGAPPAMPKKYLGIAGGATSPYAFRCARHVLMQTSPCAAIAIVCCWPRGSACIVTFSTIIISIIIIIIISRCLHLMHTCWGSVHVSG